MSKAIRMYVRHQLWREENLLTQICTGTFLATGFPPVNRSFPNIVSACRLNMSLLPRPFCPPSSTPRVDCLAHRSNAPSNRHVLDLSTQLPPVLRDSGNTSSVVSV